MRRTNRVLLNILPQPRCVLDIALPADAALLANLRNRLNHFHIGSLAAAHLASGIRSDTRNGRMFRQCAQIQPAPFPATLSGTGDNKTKGMDFVKRWDSGWLRRFHDNRQAQNARSWEPIRCSVIRLLCVVCLRWDRVSIRMRDQVGLRSYSTYPLLEL